MKTRLSGIIHKAEKIRSVFNNPHICCTDTSLALHGKDDKQNKQGCIIITIPTIQYNTN